MSKALENMACDNRIAQETQARIAALEAEVADLKKTLEFAAGYKGGEALENPPKHRFWGAGEKDCPPEIKAGNGELHTLRCKVCGRDNPRDEICLAADALIMATPDSITRLREQNEAARQWSDKMGVFSPVELQGFHDGYEAGYRAALAIHPTPAPGDEAVPQAVRIANRLNREYPELWKQLEARSTGQGHTQQK